MQNRAAVGDRAAGRRGGEDFRNRQRALAEERIVLQLQVQSLQFVEDRCHLEDCVVTALRRRTVGTDAVDLDQDLHPPPLPAVNPERGRLGGDHELRPDLVFDDVLPAEPVAVLLHSAGHQQG